MRARLSQISVPIALLVLAGCGGGEKTAPSASDEESPRLTKSAPKTKVKTETFAQPYPKGKGTASIRGKVTFLGKPPKPKTEDFGAHKDCAALHDAAHPLMKESEIVGAGGEVANVLVYISRGLEKYIFETPAEVVELDQHGCQYVPHVFGIMVEQKISIKNSDSITHNINFKPEKNPGNNISQNRKGQVDSCSFENAEVPIHFQCNMHTWMNAHCGVFVHNKFVVTAVDGLFKIDGLIPYKYSLTAWHEKFGSQTIELDLGDREAKTVDFTYSE